MLLGLSQITNRIGPICQVIGRDDIGHGTSGDVTPVGQVGAGWLSSRDPVCYAGAVRGCRDVVADGISPIGKEGRGHHVGHGPGRDIRPIGQVGRTELPVIPDISWVKSPVRKVGIGRLEYIRVGQCPGASEVCEDQRPALPIVPDVCTVDRPVAVCAGVGYVPLSIDDG